MREGSYFSFDLSKVQHGSFTLSFSMYFVHTCGVWIVIQEHEALGISKSSVCKIVEFSVRFVLTFVNSCLWASVAGGTSHLRSEAPCIHIPVRYCTKHNIPGGVIRSIRVRVSSFSRVWKTNSTYVPPKIPPEKTTKEKIAKNGCEFPKWLNDLGYKLRSKFIRAPAVHMIGLHAPSFNPNLFRCCQSNQDAQQFTHIEQTLNKTA